MHCPQNPAIRLCHMRDQLHPFEVRNAQAWKQMNSCTSHQPIQSSANGVAVVHKRRSYTVELRADHVMPVHCVQVRDAATQRSQTYYFHAEKVAVCCLTFWHPSIYCKSFGQPAASGLPANHLPRSPHHACTQLRWVRSAEESPPPTPTCSPAPPLEGSFPPWTR